jgi:hypothetical protein
VQTIETGKEMLAIVSDLEILLYPDANNARIAGSRLWSGKDTTILREGILGFYRCQPHY